MSEDTKTAWDKLKNKKTMAETEEITSDTVSEPTPEEAMELVRQKTARIAQVLARGILNDRLQGIYDTSVPDGYGGKFVRDNPDDIIRYQNLGFEFKYKEGAEGLHGTPDGRVRVGDLVLMTINPEDRHILKEAKKQQVENKLTAGRRDYARSAQKEAPGVQSFDQSDVRVHKSKTGGR